MEIKENKFMKLTTVKEIYKNREQYLDKEVTVGGWVRSVRDPKHLVLLCFMTVVFLKPFRSFIMIPWTISRISVN